MQLFSQRDPAYAHLKLGTVTVGSHGCFVCSMATLYQRHPTEILGIRGAITKNGDLASSIVAKYFGGEALKATKKPPEGWCIAVTDFYRAAGFATHFFAVNMQKGLMIDPLDYPAVVRPLTYKVKEFRPFAGVVLDTTEFEIEEYRRKLRNAEKALQWQSGLRLWRLQQAIERLKRWISSY